MPLDRVDARSARRSRCRCHDRCRSESRGYKDDPDPPLLANDVPLDYAEWLPRQGRHELRAAAPSYPGWRFSPMYWSEVERWIGSYNAWAEVWNHHETRRDLPPSPEWPDAGLLFVAGRWPRSALAFRTRTTSQPGVIRLKGWREFHEGWSFCRRPVDVARVAWAGWRASEDSEK